MSYSSDNLGEYEAARGKGEFARVIEKIDDQKNPANVLVLRALARAAELGDQLEERVSEIVESLAAAVFTQEDEVVSHSLSHEEGVGIGPGAILPYLPGWRLYIDLHAPDEEWPLVSLDPVDKIEFMLYPQTENDVEAYPYTDDLLCNLGPSAVFTRNIRNRWAYDAVNSSLELKSRAEVMDFLTGLNEGIVFPEQ